MFSSMSDAANSKYEKETWPELARLCDVPEAGVHFQSMYWPDSRLFPSQEISWAHNENGPPLLWPDSSDRLCKMILSDETILIICYEVVIDMC